MTNRFGGVAGASIAVLALVAPIVAGVRSHRLVAPPSNALPDDLDAMLTTPGKFRQFAMKLNRENDVKAPPIYGLWGKDQASHCTVNDLITAAVENAHTVSHRGLRNGKAGKAPQAPHGFVVARVINQTANCEALRYGIPSKDTVWVVAAIENGMYRIRLIDSGNGGREWDIGNSAATHYAGDDHHRLFNDEECYHTGVEVPQPDHAEMRSLNVGCSSTMAKAKRINERPVTYSMGIAKAFAGDDLTLWYYCDDICCYANES